MKKSLTFAFIIAKMSTMKFLNVKNQTVRQFGFFFLLAFAVLFICSPDSYTHDLFDRMDSAWFYMCGKAWMNGLTPYVDFADSKGPLLWFIYGIGYLLSPHSYIGVFWLSVLLYTGIFFCVFKTSTIFLKERWQSYMVVAMMVCVYFSFWFHYETLSEDWANGFVALAFYRMCLLMYSDRGREPRSVYLTCFLLGLCLAGTLLIKFNITVMLGLVYCYVLFFLFREKHNIVMALLSFLAGCAAILLPLVAYMLVAGSLSAFIQEYFINTMQTVSSSNGIANYFREWLIMTYEARYAVLFGLSVIGALMMAHRVGRYKWFFLLSFLAFYALAIHNTSPKHCHYLAICLFFPVWFVIGLLSLPALQRQSLWKKVVAVAFSYTLIANLLHWGFLVPNFFLHPNTEPRDSYYHAAYLMSQVDHPRVICYKTKEIGLGTAVESLPGTKYWAEQSGASDEMMQSQAAAVLAGKADFIIAAESEINGNDSIVIAGGYHHIYDYEYGDDVYHLYTKHQLQEPPQSFCVSRMDVLLKRNVF